MNDFAVTSENHDVTARSRFSETAATCQFSAMIFVFSALMLVGTSILAHQIPSGLAKSLFLVAMTSLAVPLAMAGRAFFLASDRNRGAARPGFMSDGKRYLGLAIVSLLGGLLLFVLAAMVQATVPEADIGVDMLSHSENARLLFGIDDIRTIKLESYTKAGDRVEAEFGLKNRQIKLVITDRANPS